MSQVVISERDIVPNFVAGNLANGTTYYFPVGGAGVLINSIHILWDAAIIITSITIEDSNITDISGTTVGAAGEWITENPTTGTYVATEGAGVTVTGSSVAVAGGAAGGCIYHLGNMATRRVRVAVVVAGTGGKLQIFPHGRE